MKLAFLDVEGFVNLFGFLFSGVEELGGTTLFRLEVLQMMSWV